MDKKKNTYTIIDETPKVEPMVSVSMLTYNHQEFIAEAIESVMMQETTFDVVLVIADDWSPDNTREIIVDYQKRYPAKIKLILQNRNVGASKNSSSIVENLNGKYIALCEGDDYWTDPLKLQKQIDFLESNSEYSMTFHNAIEIFGNEQRDHQAFLKIEDRCYSEIEVFKNWIVPTASMVFKRSIFYNAKYIEINKEADLVFGDNLLLIVSAQVGNLRGFSDIMSVYRRQEGGAVFTIKPDLIDKINKQNILFGRYFPSLQKCIKPIILKRNFINLLSSIKRSQFKNAIIYLKFLIKHK